uniref:Uncharacterized protein n=1 Tax=Arcella intermedia TaxID=1963864 RepID=A0A6B2LIY9_9EUKA
MVSVYLSATFLKDYEPTIFDVFEGNVRTGDRTVAFSLCDVAGGSTYEKLDLKKLRGVCYLDTDVYIICFSVVDRASFEHVKEEWYPEITAKGPVSVLLVGTKIDLRDAPEGKEEERERELKKAGIVPVTTEEGTNLANEINALGYMECSVLESVNLKEIFDTAIKAALAGDSNKKSDNCNVM